MEIFNSSFFWILVVVAYFALIAIKDFRDDKKFQRDLAWAKKENEIEEREDD